MALLIELFSFNSSSLSIHKWKINVAANFVRVLCGEGVKYFSNKRPMGHIAHLRKQFKSINTYDYIITLIKRRKKTLLTL